MDKFLKLIFCLLLLFSSSSFADTYPALVQYQMGTGRPFASTPDGACKAYDPTFYANGAGTACLHSDGSFASSINIVSSCPYGGTLSGTSCIDAPSCISPQIRNSLSGACQTPVVCTSPAVYDNLSNSCITPSCPQGTTRGTGLDTSCLPDPKCPTVLPLCSSPAMNCTSESGGTVTIPLCTKVCPTGTHTVGQDCVPDAPPPANCPPSMVANDQGGCSPAPPVACPPGTRPGTINGASTCQPSTSNDPNLPPDSTNTGTESGTNTETTTFKDANGNVTGSSTTTGTSSTSIKLDTTGLANQATQQGILDTLTANKATQQGILDAANSANAKQQSILDTMTTSPTLPSDPPPLNATAVNIITTPVTVGGVGTCPADSVAITSHGNFIFSMLPLCTLATSIQPLFVAICFLISGFIVFGAVKG